MQKNVAGQKIGAELVSASDGSAFTGSVTVYVTGDAGTQAVGSVGSGACTHEGNGYHTYAPAQAETNYTLIAFTFVGTGAIPVTIQVFTTGYDPTASVIPANTIQVNGTSQTAKDLGALDVTQINTLASHDPGSELAAEADVTAVEVDTQDIQSRLPASLTGAGNIKSDAQVVSGSVTLATSQPNYAPAKASDVPSAASNATAVRDELSTELGRIDEEIGSRLAAADYTAPPSVAEIFSREIEGLTFEQLVIGITSALLAKCDGMEGSTGHFRDLADTKNRITVTTDADGNRTSVTLDLS